MRALLGIPLFWKVLVANAALVVASAGAGALLTARLERAEPGASAVTLALWIAGIALVLSLLVNGVIVWVALRPLRNLEATASRVRAGDAEARVPLSPLADRDLCRLMRTFNAMLDGLSVYRGRLREIAARALDAGEEERKRIARELHDETAQSLAGLMLRLRLARATKDEEARQRVLDTVRDELAIAAERVREIAMGLRPPALEMLGLGAALRSYAATVADTARVDIDVRAEDVRGLISEEAELAVYRIVQAALSNVARHASARHAHVSLHPRDGVVQVRVDDDGCGFDVDEVLAAPDAGLGLAGMQERAAYLAGHVHIRSEPGRGTRIEVEIPYQETVAHA